MGSISATQVGYKVLDSLRKGKRPNLGKIIKESGYATTTSTVPTQVTNTKSYKKVVAPFVQKLEIERQRAIDAMKGKISKAKYRDLTDAIDKLTKNHQLLTGGATANVAMGVKRLKDDELEAIANGS